jgi:hypothetical protein
MAIRVECYAGYQGDQEPLAFWLGERRLAVHAVVDRWFAPMQRRFKVDADDGNMYVLRHDETSGYGSTGGARRPGTETPSSRRTVPLRSPWIRSLANERSPTQAKAPKTRAGTVPRVGAGTILGRCIQTTFSSSDHLRFELSLRRSTEYDA